MTKLPDEIMQEARRISCEIGKPGDGLTVRTIARALLARDQRAAEIARRKIVGGYLHGINEWPEGEDIAAAILSYDEARHD